MKNSEITPPPHLVPPEGWIVIGAIDGTRVPSKVIDSVCLLRGTLSRKYFQTKRDYEEKWYRNLATITPRSKNTTQYIAVPDVDEEIALRTLAPLIESGVFKTVAIYEKEPKLIIHEDF